MLQAVSLEKHNICFLFVGQELMGSDNGAVGPLVCLFVCLLKIFRRLLGSIARGGRRLLPPGKRMANAFILGSRMEYARALPDSHNVLALFERIDREKISVSSPGNDRIPLRSCGTINLFAFNTIGWRIGIDWRFLNLFPVFGHCHQGVIAGRKKDNFLIGTPFHRGQTRVDDSDAVESLCRKLESDDLAARSPNAYRIDFGNILETHDGGFGQHQGGHVFLGLFEIEGRNNLGGG